VAIAIRGGAPVTGSGTGATVSVTCTGTTQPQANDVLLIFHGNDFYALSAMPTPTVGGSTTGVTAVTNGTADGGSIDAHVKSWTYVVGSTGDLTVSVTETGTADEEKALAVYVLSGVDTATPVDAAAANTSTTASSTSHDAPSVSPTSADAYLVCHVNTGGGSLGGTYTPPTGMTETYDFGVAAAMEVGGAVVQLAASGATGTKTFTITGSTPYSAVSVAMKTAAAAASIPPPLARSVPLRDPGETWWTQRDRRDALTVASAANPLPSPLDTAWQADGRHWHLYNDLAYRPTLVPYAQRDRRDANTLASSATDPLTLAAGVGGDTWRRYNTPAFADRREVPAQRTYVSGPGLLATALLENELLGSVDDLTRHRQAAIYTDRRLVPQQRPYLSVPGLLDTAQLENELLGSFDDVARHRQAAAYVDRREVPQQRLYVSDPLLLGTALLENELLGSAEDLRRHAVLSAYLDRRLVPQQRPYVSDPNLLATALLEDGLLGVADDLRRRYGQAAYYDRREVPQQRAYVSDPLLLITALLEDALLGAADTGRRYLTPATHADRREYPAQRTAPAAVDDVTTVGTGTLGAWWGHDDTAAFLYGNLHPATDPTLLIPPATTDPTLSGGTGRLAVAAAYTDRREAPAQRPYTSTPGLLATAELENELLGGADDLARHRQAAAFTDRREYPQQPNRQTWYFDAGPGTPPLTLAYGDGGWMVANANQAGWQPSRRLVPQQRPYLSDPSFYPTIPPTDPLTVAWGAGGPYWHLYNTAAGHVDRREVPQQRLYVSIAGLLDTALLEGAMLGSADDLRRRYLTPGYWDRREAPQQRTYNDLALLNSALLEDGLLGAADDLRRRYQAPAELVDRRGYPQQRVYFDPAELATALLEGALLGAADDRARHAAWYPDRRQPAWQPPRYDPSLLPPPAAADPLLVAGGVGGDLWRRYQAAAYLARQAPRPWQPVPHGPVFSLAALRDLVLAIAAGEPRWRAVGGASRWKATAGTPRWTIGGR
jgi:hypothetical protein